MVPDCGTWPAGFNMPVLPNISTSYITATGWNHNCEVEVWLNSLALTIPSMPAGQTIALQFCPKIVNGHITWICSYWDGYNGILGSYLPVTCNTHWNNCN